MATDATSSSPKCPKNTKHTGPRGGGEEKRSTGKKQTNKKRSVHEKMVGGQEHGTLRELGEGETKGLRKIPRGASLSKTHRIGVSLSAICNLWNMSVSPFKVS